MSPEYAANGLLSLKYDVFSFGVIVLEILSGIRNNNFYHPDHDRNLLGQVTIHMQCNIEFSIKVTPIFLCNTPICLILLVLTFS